MSEESWESLEEFRAAQAPWIAYLVTADGEFVEIGQAPDMEGADALRHDYFMNVLEEGHSHRFFKVMGVTSHTGLQYVLREYGA